jgi:putative ABC transport system substrate-binding protein
VNHWQITVIALSLLISALLTPGVSRAERDRPVRIGALTESWGPTPGIVGLHDGLLELGYREDEDFVLGVRFTQGNIADLPAAARELAQFGVDLMFTSSVNATKAAQGTTRQLPIVFTAVDDPIAFDLIKSYAQPGGNTTGVTDLAIQLGPKRLQLFSEMIPDLKRVLFPYYVSDTVSVKESQAYRQAARRLGIEVVDLPLQTQAEAQAKLIQKQDEMVQGFLSPRNLLLNIPGFVLQAASEQKMPAIFSDVFFVEHGGLASYGPDLYESGKLAARQVDKILKGAKPADIPVEVNTKIEFTINLKTAKALGLTIPPEILFQATKVIR